MEPIVEKLTTPTWWITVVLAGIVINLVAAYVKPLFDREASKLSRRYKNVIRERAEKKSEELEKLSKDPHGQVLERLYAVSLRVHGLTILVCGLMLFLVFDRFSHLSNEYSSLALLGGIAIFAFQGFIATSRGHSSEKKVLRAQELMNGKKNENESNK